MKNCNSTNVGIDKKYWYTVSCRNREQDPIHSGYMTVAIREYLKAGHSSFMRLNCGPMDLASMHNASCSCGLQKGQPVLLHYIGLGTTAEETKII